MKKHALILAFLAPLVAPAGRPVAAAVVADPYTSGLSAAQEAAAQGEFGRAEALLARLLRGYGENAELLAARGRIYFWQKRYDEALVSLNRAQRLKPTAEVATEIRKVQTAEQLARADRLVTQGELLQAGALLTRTFEGGTDRYGAGTRLATVRNRQGRHRDAAKVYQLLMRDYPNDTEIPLLYASAVAHYGEREEALRFLESLAGDGKDPRPFALRGRILFGEGRLLEARDEYEKAKRLGGTPELAAERKRVEDALAYQHVRALVAAGGYELAEPLLKSMSAPGPYAREARLLSGRVLLAQRRYAPALAHGRTLYEEYPNDPEVTALYAEALLENGRAAEAEDVLLATGGSAGGTLRSEREDLFYRTKGNWLRLGGGAYGYSSRSETETWAGVSVAQRFRRVTGVASVSQTTRFGTTDPQLALDLYFPRWEGGRLSAALYLSAAPGSDFLPRYTAGGELGWSLGPVELSGGYNRLEFREDPADVLSATVLWYIPATPFTLAEKVYYTPESGGNLWVTTVSWDPSHRYRIFLSGGLGDSSERRFAREDLQLYDTYLVRGGGEYRFSPSYSVGGEGNFESRRGLYDRVGGSLYLRYWW